MSKTKTARGGKRRAKTTTPPSAAPSASELTSKTKRKRRATPAATGSVVPTSYRDRYKDGSCGDDTATALKKHTAAEGGGIDLKKLRAVAEANGIWKPEYAKLNPGLQRMSIGNRLRALARHGVVKWGK